MKENVIDVLMYLFENYMDEGPEFNPDQETLTLELSQAGFPRGEISKAFSWLEDLSSLRERAGYQLPAVSRPSSLRCYSPFEREKMSIEARGFIAYLEQSGVLDPVTRELVIERVMALETDEIELEQLKWVILMVLFNRPDQELAYAWMEDMVFEGFKDRIH